MVPDSVDDRVLEEHILRDASSAVVSRSSSLGIHAQLGYAYDFIISAIFLCLIGAALYVAIKVYLLARKKSGSGSPILPISSSFLVSSTSSLGSSSPPLTSSLSSLPPSSSFAHHREKSNTGSSFDKLFALVSGGEPERLRQD
ncbi:hypothetical protein V1514DRAFT_340318 [Lipomyces japonicus]|uniref:uncharacterized protein n=1 Tax=Lipomyces japonicus TaxID=56871 RepID=UPI0034CD0DF4